MSLFAGSFGFTLGSGRGSDMLGTERFDPKEKSAVRKKVERWRLTTLHEKRIKIGAKVVYPGRHITF